MEDYPRNLLELERISGTEAGCAEYLAAIRWPAGFRCPKCGEAKCWRTWGSLMICAGCQRRISVKAGTIFQDSRTPLPLWFRAAWWLIGQKNGCGAKGLPRTLGIGSYETAWTMLHKFRRAMVFPDRKSLSGLVEVDETYVAHEHLQSYLDEFVFRFNCRTSRSRGLLFRRLLENAIQTPPAPYQSIIKLVRKRKR